jgi:deoxyribodipyrimidine photo-lyase
MIDQLVWLRNDLRLDDHPALSLVQQQGMIRVVYISTPKQWQRHFESPARLGLKAAALRDIAERLADKGIQFDCLECDFFDDVPKTLLSFCLSEGIKQVWFNAETPLDEKRRDEAVVQCLGNKSISCHDCGFDLLVANNVFNLQGLPFKVFTPFYKRWLLFIDQHSQKPFAEPKHQGEALPIKQFQLAWGGDFRDDLWPGNENNALQKLNAFCRSRLSNYDEVRDVPSISGTSTLSPYLANGQLGPRRIIEAIKISCTQAGRDWQSDPWLRELAWRDFYRQLLHHFPRLSMGEPFKIDTDKLVWNDNDLTFQAWCEGRTGFPIIDAAMRQLLQTGWMHNRLRMLAASFLTKILFIDWRRGEKFFMSHLIDGEFAANNGGWQWSASVGCDAAPYFRVFNPIRQSQKFDPNGEFIRRFVPELKSLSDKAIHAPSVEDCQRLAYPEQIVDYKLARQYAIDQFKNLKTL